MTTPLEKEFKREVEVQGQPFTLTVSPQGLKLVPKGKRNGVELHWSDLISGDAALSAALNASLDKISRFPEPVPSPTPPRQLRTTKPGLARRRSKAPRPRCIGDR